jgi:hypothetical protein
MHLLGIFFFPFIGFGCAMYFLPSLLAVIRNKRDTLTIFLVNFLLGWSVIGWVVCLVWALKTDQVMYVRQ